MRVVVTGGAGFIGSAFINFLKENFHCEILCIDSLTYCSNIKNIKHDVEFLHKDICDVTSEDLGEYDYLVNFAAESHVDNSIKNGKPFIKSNIEGTFNLLECARQNPTLIKFIQISTDEVYGDMDSIVAKHKSASEDDCLNPSSYYSASKAAADLLVKSCHRTYGLPYLITRTCNNYGEHQFEEKFLPVIYKSIKEGKKIPVYGDGKQSREWIYVYDNVRIISELMFNEHIVNDVYNIGSNIEYKNIEIIEMIQEIVSDNKAQIEFVKDRPGHDRVYRLNLSKIKNYFSGFEITKSFLDIKNYLKNIYGS